LAAVASSTLRPLSVGEILDAGVKVVTRNWKPLLGSLLLVSTPVWALFILLLASLDASAFEFTPDQEFGSTEDPSAQFLIGLMITLFVLMLAFLVSFVAVFKGVCDAWLGIKPTIGRSLKFGLKRSGWVFLLSLVWTPCITLFMLPCGIPALWLGTVWALSIPALLFERVGPFKALGRSYGLIRGRFWEALLVVLVVVGVYYVVSNILSLGLMGIVAVATDDNAIANAIAQGAGSIVSTAVSVPYISALLTILYFDQRVRKEGLDIQLLAEGNERDPNAPLPLPLQAPAGYTTPPPPAWGPPGWQSPSGWVGPQAPEAGPLRWGPNAPAPTPRPPSDSPWMAPAPGPAGPPPDAPPLWRQPTGNQPPAAPGAPPAAADAPGSPPPAADAPGSPAPAAGTPDSSPPAGAAPWMTPGEERPAGWAPPKWEPSSAWKPSGGAWKPAAKEDDEDEGTS
jgi:hypothetical protein